MSLIAALNELQRKEGYLTEAALRALSAERRVPLHAIQAVISFYPHFHTKPPPATRLAVCRDMVCHLAGAPQLHGQLNRSLANADSEVCSVSCLGRCDAAPAVMVNDAPFDNCTADQIINAASDPDPAQRERPASTGRRWQYNAYDAGAEPYALIKLIRAGQGPNVLRVLKESGLRGMGGAAFPAGVKWEMVAGQAEPTKTVICNADESEPGTFKDRVILSELPHLVLEAMAVAGHVIGARKGYVFIRHEYEAQRQCLAAEIDRARGYGVFNDSFEVEIFTSPGGYILGEETALLECMEDKRGEPRNKPPFPGKAGLHGKPTLINNVETFAAATAILNRGADWWKSAGTNGCHGYKFISASGHVVRPDVYQVPMGTTVRQLIELAGGVVDGKVLKAFAPGGASSNFLPADKADTPIDFDHMAKAGSMLGSGALFVVAEGTDMFELVTTVLRFFRNESCGKCVPCRVGTDKAVHMLEEILEHGGRGEQLDLLGELADTLMQTSICGLGQIAIQPVLSIIKQFPDDVARHVRS